MVFLYLLFSFFFVCGQIYAETLIITHAFNRPDFIDMQCKTFAHNLKNPYRFVGFNDANTHANCEQIEQACARNGIQCIRVPQEIHDRPYLKRAPGESFHRPNVRHMNAMQYSMDTVGFKHDGIVWIIDSDMFLTRSLDIEKYMEDYDIVAVRRGASEGGREIYYLWPGLCILNMNRLPGKDTLNFNCGMIDKISTDSGGYSYYYLNSHPELRIKDVDEIFSYRLFCPDRFANFQGDNNTPLQEKINRYKQMNFNDVEIGFLLKKPHTISYLLDNSILHYRAGTNYDNQSINYDKIKMGLINEFIASVLSSN